MSRFVRLCRKCNSNNKNKDNITLRWLGYSTYLDENNYICEICGSHLIDTNMMSEEYNIITDVSSDPTFLESMISLKEKDPIEYQLKLSQFKVTLSQTKESENKVRCPKCGSTSISTGARGVNHFWGFIGASKAVNRCASCGHTWKP